MRATLTTPEPAGSQGDTGEAYLLASFNSDIAAMLLFSCSSAVSTPAVTSSAACTRRLWLIKLVNSRPSSWPAPLEWYSSYR